MCFLRECFTHFPTKPSSSILENEDLVLTKLWLKVRSLDTSSFVDPANASATCSNKSGLKKQSSFSGLQYHGKWAPSSLSGIDSRGLDFPRWQGPRWVVEHHRCPRWLGSRQQRFRDQDLFLDLVLDLDLNQPLSQRTFLLNGLVPNVLDAVHVSKLREHLFLHKRLQERTPDHRHRHPRREGLPIARFCFVIALCAANFKPTVTWKRNSTVIVVGDQSKTVKLLIFVEKVQVFQGCLCIPMASVTSRWEREKQLTFEQKFRQELEHEHPKTTWSL